NERSLKKFVFLRCTYAHESKYPDSPAWGSKSSPRLRYRKCTSRPPPRSLAEARTPTYRTNENPARHLRRRAVRFELLQHANDLLRRQLPPRHPCSTLCRPKSTSFRASSGAQVNINWAAVRRRDRVDVGCARCREDVRL